MVWRTFGSKILCEVCFLCLIIAHLSDGDNSNHHPNHRHSLMTMSDLANHWIGMPKSPYVHYSAAISTTTAATVPPTSSPISVKRIQASRPKKKQRKNDEKPPRRRADSGASRKKDRNYYDDVDEPSDYNYDYDDYVPNYARVTPPPSQYIIRGSDSPKTMYMNPSESSPSVNKIFAAVPKVATYVVPSSKTYVVHRVKSEAVYIPPVAKHAYTASNSPGMRRQDPLDYDDGGSYLNLGPRDSFPPRPVMNKIAGPGQRQPCHGPECHQHHKGLVRFYWRRVIYPPGSDGRRRRPTRFRNRRRFRERARSPSDQKETFASDEEEDSEEENADEDPEEDVDEEETENTGNWRQGWRPGRAYGHDLDEGQYYSDEDKKVYRDKRYANKHRRIQKIAY